MKNALAVRITLLLLLIAGLAVSLGCDDVVRGGADVILEGVSMGTVSMDGKPIQGMPSQKIDVVLKVATNEVVVTTSGDTTTLKLNPSGATVVITSEGTTFTGVEAEDVELKWQTTDTE